MNISKCWRYLESGAFIIVAPVLIYFLAKNIPMNVLDSLKGEGFVGALTTAIQSKKYETAAVIFLSTITTIFLLLEIIKLIVAEWPRRPRDSVSSAATPTTASLNQFSSLWKNLLTNYKSNFLAMTFLGIISKVIPISVLVLWMPYFKEFTFFNTGSQWYWWLYALLVWELSYWAWHYSAHRIRLFWCLHSPHHAPSEMNVTVNFQIFFAQGYYSAIIQLPILMLLGVKPAMVLVIMTLNDAWGYFLHSGERSFKNGRLGVLQYFIMTPSHHRVHHAKNPLYIDTNFCLMLPFWDWLFGTLQLERKESKIEYGITRDLDVTNFIDLYFGECVELISDVKNATGIKNKLLYIIMPPGWTPHSRQKTGAVIRAQFLEEHPNLSQTSYRRITIRKKES